MRFKNHLPLLIGGDLIVLLVVIWLGRLSHTISVWDISGWLFTSAPFVIAWFAVTPWFGLFKADISQTWAKFWPRLLLGWGLIGCPLGLMLRSLFLGRPIIEGIIPIFAVIMFVTTTLAIMLWRGGYMWWSHRSEPQLHA